MANEFEIEDFLQRLKDIYGDRFNTKPATISVWLKGLKYIKLENLEKALQYWIENNQKTPTLSDIRYTARRYEPARSDYSKPEDFELEKRLEDNNLKSGFRKMRISNNAITWKSKEGLCIYKGQHVDKIDAILDYFGHKEWIELLKSHVNIKLEDGLFGINKILHNQATRKSYKELIDNHLSMVPGVELI